MAGRRRHGGRNAAVAVPGRRSPVAYLCGSKGVIAACIIYISSSYVQDTLFHRNLKCLGSDKLIPSHSGQHPWGGVGAGPHGGTRNERTLHSCPNWDPASGLSPLHTPEESLHTQTCIGLTFAPSWRADLSFSGQCPVGKQAGSSQLSTWQFP